MYEIHVSIEIAALRAQVFEAIADHERFLAGPGMSCRLTVEGSEDRNGLGAVREVAAAPFTFTEEITRFEPPHRFDYVIRKLVRGADRRVPLRHEGGWVELTEHGGATRVDWYSRFELEIPLVGWLIARIAARSTRKAFARLLARAKSRLEDVEADKARAG